MSAELFKLTAGINLLNITYRGMGGGAYTDLLSGRVQVAFANLPSAIGYIRSGRLRALGVTTTMRSEILPDLPSISEFIPGYEVSVFYGLSAPKNTPPDIVEKLNKAVNAGLADPVLKAKLANLGGMMLPGSAEAFGKIVAGETEKWAGVIHRANLKLMN